MNPSPPGETSGIAIDAICAGDLATLPSGKRSGIAKRPLDRPVEIGLRGLASDRQGDRRHHGFPAMALHQFPSEHYHWLRKSFGPLDRLDGPGSMGENIAAADLTEADVAIGDRFRLGTALIEVSQPRQPCVTIEQHLGVKGIVKAMIETARSGWFYRVLEPGRLDHDDRLVPIERGTVDWTIERVFRSVYGPKPDFNAMRTIAALPGVSDRLVHDIGKRLS
ncbi:MOSC domain-containing protein [Qipengyuania sp.]|uniref:MOSC domain-containing protein n=1 Tax=Qipengyuania sp. TaxID=2004515 RepID=UPI0037353C87